MTLVVNLVGGPGTGKSTTAAGLFFELKSAGFNAEYVSEYAKDAVWGQATHTLNNQIYVFGKQQHRLWRLQGQVDVVVTDCPLILSMYYGAHMKESFHNLVLDTFHEFNNYNVFLERKKAYNPKGRVQTEAKARDIDFQLRDLMWNNNIEFDTYPATYDTPNLLKNVIVKKLA